MASRISLSTTTIPLDRITGQTLAAKAHEGRSTLWHLADVLSWLQAKGSYRLEQAVLDVAVTAMQINLVRQARQITAQAQREVRSLVA